MGGSITVESKQGEGSLFLIELELEAADQEDQAESDNTLKPQFNLRDTGFLKGRRFLIAEDNEINSEILESLLKMHGAASDTKPDGA